MHGHTLRSLTLLGVAALVMMVVGCTTESPEEKVARLRAAYTVELTSFTVQEPEPTEDAGEAMGEAAAVASAEAAAEAVAEAMETAAGEEMEEEMETGPRSVDVSLQLLVRFSGEEALPGVTVEVAQADASGEEKARTLQWIDAAGMQNEEVRQVDFELEDVEYEDGDAFSVLLREVVPLEERGRYREFAEAGS